MRKLLVIGLLVAGIGRGQDLLSLSASSPPSVVSVTPSRVGAQGSNTECYRVVARYPVGNAAPSPEACVNNAFGVGGTVTITWTPVAGAIAYDVLRTNGQGPAGTCTNCLLLSGTTANTATDTNATLAGYTFTTASSANGFIQLVNGAYATPEFFMYPYPIRIGVSLVFPDGSVQTTANVAGVGTVTHTAGNLTLNNLICGNAIADVKVCNVLTDINSTGVLNTVNANVGQFGDGANVAQVTVDGKGRITAVANVPIAGVGGTPCVTTALSLQFNNAGAFGCLAQWTYAAAVLTGSAAAKLDASAATGANIKFPLGTLFGGFSFTPSGNITFTGAFNPTFQIPSSSTWIFPTGGATLLANDASNAVTFVHDILFTDATYDIGKTGATRPRDIFASRNGVFGGTLTIPAAGILDMSAATTTNIKFPAGFFQVAGGNLTSQVPINFLASGTPASLTLVASNPAAGNIQYTLGGGTHIVLDNAVATATGGNLYDWSAARFRTQNSAADPGTCAIGELYFNTGAANERVCTAPNTWTALATAGAVAWSALTAPGGPLSLTMGANTSTFNTTTAVAQFFAWKNTTPAVIGTSQASPVLSLCGTSFHGGASAEDCLTLQDTPGTGTDAAITFNIGHTGTSTGIVTTTFPGPIQAGLSGGQGGTLTLPEGTAATAVAANEVCYGDSTLHGIKCANNAGSFLPLPLMVGALNVGHIVDINSANTLEDSGLVTANTPSAAANYVNGNLIQGAGANKTTSDSGIATLNVVTAGSNYTTAHLIQAAANDKSTSDSGITVARVTNQFTRTASVTDLAPAIGDSGLLLVIDPATAIHLTRVWCAIQGATNVVLNLDKRAEATIGSDSGAHLLGAGPTDLTAVSGGATTSTWNNANCGGVGSCAIAAHAPVVMTFTSINGTPTALNCSVEYLVD